MNIKHDIPAWSDMSSRVLVAALFFALAWRLGNDFVETQRPTDLLMLVGEALVVVLTCLRRPAQIVDRRAIRARKPRGFGRVSRGHKSGNPLCPWTL